MLGYHKCCSYMLKTHLSSDSLITLGTPCKPESGGQQAPVGGSLVTFINVKISYRSCLSCFCHPYIADEKQMVTRITPPEPPQPVHNAGDPMEAFRGAQKLFFTFFSIKRQRTRPLTPKSNPILFCHIPTLGRSTKLKNHHSESQDAPFTMSPFFFQENIANKGIFPTALPWNDTHCHSPDPTNLLAAFIETSRSCH